MSVLQYSGFVIDDKPYCLWEWDFKERNISFIRGVDPHFFGYLAEVHQNNLGDKNKQHFAAE